jgi:hypothetical protein
MRIMKMKKQSKWMKSTVVAMMLVLLLSSFAHAEVSNEASEFINTEMSATKVDTELIDLPIILEDPSLPEAYVTVEDEIPYTETNDGNVVSEDMWRYNLPDLTSCPVENVEGSESTSGSVEGEDAFVEPVSVDALPVDEVYDIAIPVDEVAVDEVPVDEVPVDEVPVDEVAADEVLYEEIKSEDGTVEPKYDCIMPYYRTTTPGDSEELNDDVPVKPEVSPELSDSLTNEDGDLKITWSENISDQEVNDDSITLTSTPANEEDVQLESTPEVTATQEETISDVADETTETTEVQEDVILQSAQSEEVTEDVVREVATEVKMMPKTGNGGSDSNPTPFVIGALIAVLLAVIIARRKFFHS